MPSKLDETLQAAGYAKVLVTLADGAATALDDAAQLADSFILPPQAEEMAAAAAEVAHLKALPPTPRLKVYPNLGLALGYVDGVGAAALRASARVHSVDEAPEISLIRPVWSGPAEEGAAAAAETWGLRRIRAPELWARGFTGAGVRVAHLDTGVDGTHPAFGGGAIAAFAEFDWAGNIVPDAPATDSGDHGTHTAATILGRGAGPTGRFGVAPDALLVSAMVIEGGQVIDRILGGMDWAVGQDVRILSMSLGLRGYTSAFQTLIDALRARNVLPVIAVGNEGPNTSRSPGNYANVLSVGAMDSADHVAAFSGSQTFNRIDDPLVPDLVAPGVDVVSRRSGRRLRPHERQLHGHAARRRPRRPAGPGGARRHRHPARTRHPAILRAARYNALRPREPRRSRRRPRPPGPGGGRGRGRRDGR
ncbi:S8 family serine peptidase [Phenylobacterium sp. J367]|nr:S8 family serine peptidase [Phenylobacterium sp. J367]MCR5877666.1 S8 family serine peptidase [Phenylobacterium sp. J367]